MVTAVPLKRLLLRGRSQMDVTQRILFLRALPGDVRSRVKHSLKATIFILTLWRPSLRKRFGNTPSSP